jgi:hypothetical protein
MHEKYQLFSPFRFEDSPGCKLWEPVFCGLPHQLKSWAAFSSSGWMHKDNYNKKCAEKEAKKKPERMTLPTLILVDIETWLQIKRVEVILPTGRPFHLVPQTKLLAT